MFLKNIGEAIMNFLSSTGIFKLLSDAESISDFALKNNWWQTVVMILIAFVLIYLAIGKKFEPLLLRRHPRRLLRPQSRVAQALLR